MAGVRVLLVDDDARHLELIGAMLEPTGYQMLSTHTAEEALSAIAREHTDLVITDVNLPGMSGLQLVRRLKGDAKLRRIPVLVLSGHAMPEDEQVARMAGCDGYLVKPAEGQRLRAEVERLLRSF
ncbi:MAG: hypothetical protein AUH85_06915 [Chloroflexi bacterium 13_1_40CM_4_68_4]|nr:MAG: hypothetical protein AUH85_06915 [Chloroflexi bacterium 13_1_40CM_4_68_4]